MATITIENVPDEIVLEYGVKIKYTNGIRFPTRNRISDKIEYFDDLELDNLGKTITFTSKSF